MKKISTNSAGAKAADKAAEWIIAFAGLSAIAAMFAMLVLIVREAAPLFFPASQRAAGFVSLPDGIGPDDVAAIGVEADLHDSVRVAGVILKDGRCGFAIEGDRGVGEFAFSHLPESPADSRIVYAQAFSDATISTLWDDGTVAQYVMQVEFSAPTGDRPGVETSFNLLASDNAGGESGVPHFALIKGRPGDYRMVAVHSDRMVAAKRVQPKKGIAARGKSLITEKQARLVRGGAPCSIALGGDDTVYIGTDAGSIISLDPSGDGDIAFEITPAFSEQVAITALALLNGGYALAVGTSAGDASIWFPRREQGSFRLRRSTGWDGDGSALRSFAVSNRDRGCIALCDDGGMQWLYSTTGKRLLRFPASDAPARMAALNRRSDNLAALHADGTVRFHRLDSSYPEAGWAGFFKKLLYEGYEKPAFVWQSTGSDESEAKLSLVPLIWGSMKAAGYAMAFATPIALAAAMYLSQFSTPAWRMRLKPAIEMLAAVPSVVIGFIAALWLAPLLEKHLHFIGQHFQYDQRNSLVIAIAMGFAVIPTVFSLAEDAISAVPPALSAASLALGASKWQTVTRVVIPAASPGIFTAVMLGFGRAVGETMIVLMAAGNTPVISLSPFNGMRTLSANIAVEMPEAPVGGALYRTLFLCALILFVLTLIINTAAEVFRHNLRRRYGKV